MEFNKKFIDLRSNGVIYISDMVEKADLNMLENKILNEKIINMLIMGSGVYSNYALEENSELYGFIIKLLEKLKSELSVESIYFFNDANFDIQHNFGKPKSRASGWHRDNNRDQRVILGQDWSPGYNLYRLGIYINDYSNNSGSVSFINKSNLKPTPFNLVNYSIKALLSLLKFNKRLKNKFINLIREPLYLLSRIFLSTRYESITPGSIAVWDLRTMHCGNTMVRKNGDVLPRFMIDLLPNWIISKIIKPFPDKRISMFITFAIGENEKNIKDYLKYFYPNGVFGKNSKILKI